MNFLTIFVLWSMLAQIQNKLPMIGAAPAGTIPITSAAVPAHGGDAALFNHLNVFSLTDASTTGDNSGDWRKWVATANDPTIANTHHINGANIQLRKNPVAAKISDLTFTGVAGPSISSFASNAFFDWSVADNDMTGIDYSSDYYYFIGNGINYVRPPGSSYHQTNCATGTPTLITNCAISFTVTPAKAGAQNLYVWTRASGASARVTVSQGGASNTSDVNTGTANAVDEHQFTIALNPPDGSTAYTVKLQPLALQSSATAAYLSIMAAALGGVTPGNVPDATLALPSYYGGTPTLGATLPYCDAVSFTADCVGTRIHQANPSSRIPTAAHSVTLGLTDSLQTAINNTLTVTDGGTDIHLPLGYRSDAQITLYWKPETNTNWVRIIADGARNTFGQRAQPADYPRGSSSPALLNFSADLSAVVQNDATNADPTKRAAHHYAIIGAEITAISNPYPVNYNLVAFSNGSNPVPASVSHDIIIQGAYIHRDSTQANSCNGVVWNVNAGAIYDSVMTGFQDSGHCGETHALYWDSAAGPETFTNNHFSAATEDVISGGQISTPFLVTKDIEFKGNLFKKDPAWLTQNPYIYDVKNSLEFKEGMFVSVTGNVFQNSYAGTGQIGQSVFLRSYSFGTSQRRGTSNYLVENNIMRHVSYGVQVEALDLYSTRGDGADGAHMPKHYAPRQYNIVIRNNSMEDLSYSKWGALARGQGTVGSGLFFIGGGLPTNLTIDRNSGWFDSATDNPLGYQDNNLAFYITNMGTLKLSDQQALVTQQFVNPGSISGIDLSPDESVASFALTSNILGGSIRGDNIGGAFFFSPSSNVSNNSFYNLPTYIDNSFTNRPTQPVGTGNTHTTSAAIPAVTGRGVNTSTLPTDCTVITGNRSDVSCTTGQ